MRRGEKISCGKYRKATQNEAQIRVRKLGVQAQFSEQEKDCRDDKTCSKHNVCSVLRHVLCAVRAADQGITTTANYKK